MRFDVLTLFPEIFSAHLGLGVTRRAFESRQVDVRLWQLREFALDLHRRVDDRPYGGGPGMVMLAEPLDRAIRAVHDDRNRSEAGQPEAPLIHFTPTGQPLSQALVHFLSQSTGALLLCGRYEGIDQRLLDRHVTMEISLGDFVLSGGEIPALALLDAVARLQEGVLGDAQSHQQDSFSDGLLDCPHFSRPETWASDRGSVSVPDVLLSGHHAAIARWRRERSLELTARRRPDLISAARAKGKLTRLDEAFLGTLNLD